jgi:hypothetical protein
MTPDDLKSRAGQLLYRELPVEYRYLDPPPEDGELGDLEAYLHGFGHLLDLVRGTTEQAYADAFAETADNGRDIQSWLLPYLAELVGTKLRVPDPAMRRIELNNAVSWFKSKGTLQAVDDITDVVAGAETVVVEGWRRTLTTPRMMLPPFTSTATLADDATGERAPGGAPDLRFTNRAIEDANGSNPLYEIRTPERDDFGRTKDPNVVYWRSSAQRGSPCFPGAYDDTAMRTPDLRAPGTQGLGPHPTRAIVHVRPPDGFFARGLNGTQLAPTIANLPIDSASTAHQVIGPEHVLRAMGQLDQPAVEALRIDGEPVLPDRLEISGDLVLPDGVDVEFQDLVFSGSIRLTNSDTRLTMLRCAAERVILEHPTDEPGLQARDCLFNRLRGGVGFARLIYCTVLEEAQLERLQASDCIFNGPMEDIDCSGDSSCLRFSRLPSLKDLEACGADKAPSNTDEAPNFIRLWFEEGDICVLRTALFGEPGAGVLDLTSSTKILAGAEDEGEMGAYHHKYHAAKIRALRLKLADFLPFGQEISINYDPYLFRPPARAI